MNISMDVVDQETVDIEEGAVPTRGYSEVEQLTFDAWQAQRIEAAAVELARLGGPQVRGAKWKAAYCAREIAASLDEQQSAAVRRFARNELSLLIFKGMLDTAGDDLPTELPQPSELENDFHCLRLASRNQILLQLVGQRAFAYDIDNQGRLVRLVGNFKGGGKTRIRGEAGSSVAELSSHSGLALGAHTEAPYFCSTRSSRGHSPAPSSLILTARWNPRNEPTTVIPMYDIIERLGAHHALALTSKTFGFTRSDSFVSGKGEDGFGVSILEFDHKGAFAIRYNSYRFLVCDDAPPAARVALQRLTEEIERGARIEFALQPDTAIAINNCRALHCREVIADNRRLLVRLFGYSEDAEPIVLSDDPLLVRG